MERRTLELSLDPAFSDVDEWKLSEAFNLLDQPFARMKTGVVDTSPPAPNTFAAQHSR
jgi:hypothetical protein